MPFGVMKKFAAATSVALGTALSAAGQSAQVNATPVSYTPAPSTAASFTVRADEGKAATPAAKKDKEGLSIIERLGPEHVKIIQHSPGYTEIRLENGLPEGMEDKPGLIDNIVAQNGYTNSIIIKNYLVPEDLNYRFNVEGEIHLFSPGPDSKKQDEFLHSYISGEMNPATDLPIVVFSVMVSEPNADRTGTNPILMGDYTYDAAHNAPDQKGWIKPIREEMSIDTPRPLFSANVSDANASVVEIDQASMNLFPDHITQEQREKVLRKILSTVPGRVKNALEQATSVAQLDNSPS